MKKIKDIIIREKKCMNCRKNYDKKETCLICGFPLKKRGNYKRVNLKLKKRYNA
jgi:rRNA maturation endonuclease Nob1